ncbi:hypothetical protein HDU67_001730, partial [Dinochytrium kinnereticum]
MNMIGVQGKEESFLSAAKLLGNVINAGIVPGASSERRVSGVGVGGADRKVSV